MDMEGEWEVVDSSSGSGTEENTQGLDHLSLGLDEAIEDGSAESGSPGWIEPRSDAPYGPKHLSELWSDSSSDDLGLESDVGGNESIQGHGESLAIDPCGDGGEEKGLVWWKLPIELFKYCVFKVNPLWSFSMAAALVAFLMLGRRLYNMRKNKTRTLQLNLLLHDKKLLNHAARLNEAISIVKRVPIIRPALPSSSVAMNQWSMMRA